jgi:hypothetical protein
MLKFAQHLQFAQDALAIQHVGKEAAALHVEHLDGDTLCWIVGAGGIIDEGVGPLL